MKKTNLLRDMLRYARQADAKYIAQLKAMQKAERKAKK